VADALKQLDKAAQIETLAGELYRLMAARLPAGSSAQVVLSRLADEEEEHARRIAMLRDAFLRQPDAFCAERFNLPGADELIEDGLTLQRLLSDPGSTFSPNEARRFMIEQERRFGVAHAQALSADASPMIARFFASLAKQDEVHVRVLEQLRIP